MRLGASIWGFFHKQDPATWSSMAEAVDVVLRLDESLGIEIWGSRSREEAMVAGTKRAELADACQAAAFVTVHVQRQHWAWDPKTLRKEVDLAHQLRAETLVLHPVCFGLEDADDRPDWPEIVRIADYAAKFGVSLAVENIVDSVWSLDRILEELGDNPDETNVGVCVDVGHAALSKDAGLEPICNYLDRYAGQLLHLHLHDNTGESDDHLTPGEGSIKWARVFERIDRIGFSGTGVLEAHDPSITPRACLEQGLRFLGDAMDR